MRDYIWKNKKYTYISIAILTLCWILSSKIVNNDVIIPSPRSTIYSLITIITGENFAKYIFKTLSRSLYSFLISVGLSILIGIPAGIAKVFYNMMIPIVSILKSVPTMAIIILTLIWLSSDTAPILIGIIVVFPILYESVVKGMLNVDGKLIQMANLHSVRIGNIIKDIYIPTVYIYLSSVLGSAFGLTLKSVIAGEVLGQPRFSIGGSLQLEKLYLNTSGVFAWIIVVVILTALIEQGIRIIFIKSNSWK